MRPRSTQTDAYTQYIVYNQNNGNRFTFSRPPNLLTDLPPDFSAPGDVVTIEQTITARSQTQLIAAVRTKGGYSITDYTLNQTYTIAFDPDKKST